MKIKAETKSVVIRCGLGEMILSNGTIITNAYAITYIKFSTPAFIVQSKKRK